MQQSSTQSKKRDGALFLRIGKCIWKFLEVVGVVLALYLGYDSLSPKISAFQAQPLDIAHPFSNPFIVSNDGIFPMKKVSFD